eukprot:Em0022g799a
MGSFKMLASRLAIISGKPKSVVLPELYSMLNLHLTDFPYLDTSEHILIIVEMEMFFLLLFFEQRIEVDDIPKIAAELPMWTQVAQKLDIGQETIQDMQANSKVAADHRREFLRHWVNRDAEGATYEKLSTCLDELGQKGAAMKIRQIGRKRCNIIAAKKKLPPSVYRVGFLMALPYLEMWGVLGCCTSLGRTPSSGFFGWSHDTSLGHRFFGWTRHQIPSRLLGGYRSALR